MSELYDYLKYNVLKINHLYTNGINISLSKNEWTPVFSGDVSLEGKGIDEQAKDFVMGDNYSIQIRQSIMSSYSNSMPAFLGTYGGKVATPTSTNLTLVKNTSYKLSVENTKINFGETAIGSFGESFATDSFGNPVGPTITIKGSDQSNRANIGICTATLTTSHEYMDYSQPVATKITNNTYAINSIQVQPSQRSCNLNSPYLKISYKENVIEIADDIYFCGEKIDFSFDVYFDKTKPSNFINLNAVSGAILDVVNKFKAQGGSIFNKVTFKEIGDYSGHFTFFDANLSSLAMVYFTKLELIFEHVDSYSGPRSIVVSLSSAGCEDIGVPPHPGYEKYFPVFAGLRGSFPAFLFANLNDFIVDIRSGS